tara:strand:- start:366 stop:494 length:129 start_codon:yes stop_codon:yes gene_type:complete
MEIFCALFFVLVMIAASTLLPIIFAVGILYIVWRILKKKEWV